MTYETKSGDTFDSIAFEVLGDCRYIGELMKANRAEIGTFIFSAGTKITIPEVEKKSKIAVPPWQR